MTDQKLKAEVEKLDKGLDTIVEKLVHSYNDYEFPYEKVKLTLDDFLQLTLMRKTSTLTFGAEVNEQRKWLPARKAMLVDPVLRSPFWWPAVNGLWELQSFSAKTDDGVTEIYYLARIGSITIQTNADPQVNNDIYWLGVKTKRCYH